MVASILEYWQYKLCKLEGRPEIEVKSFVKLKSKTARFVGNPPVIDVIFGGQ